MQNELVATDTPRVLIVDDDATMRLLMTETLAEDGYIIEEVDNGPAAIDAILSFQPDMVLLDVKMPGMSGFEVCSEIRRLTGDTEISVVMVTGLDDSESIEKAFQLGATAFITKPINWDTFPYRIQYLLKARNAIVALKQRELHLEYTERISRILTQSKNKDTILEEVLREMLDIFSAGYGSVFTATDKSYSKIHIVSESASSGFSEMTDEPDTLVSAINKEILHRSNHSEYPLVVTGKNLPLDRLLMPLHVHNTHAWFLTLLRHTTARPWSASEQETFYIIGLRLTGVLSRYLLMEKLHQSESLLRQAQHVGHIGNWHWQAGDDFLSWSDEMFHIYGYKSGSFVPTLDIFHQSVLEEDHKKQNQFEKNVFTTGEVQRLEHRIRLPGGEVRWVYQQAVCKLDEEGRLVEVNGIVQDITDRIRKQEQETHNHKMEAIGQLTSGVAHDFGNLMTIARGNLELLDESFEEDHRITGDDREILEDARSAIQDSVELTKQLLAFSRKKSLAQEYINVEEHITKWSKLFKQTLGDQIELKIDIENDLPDVLVDAAQFESSLLNIILNAVNAMPGGGVITISATIDNNPQAANSQITDSDIKERAVCITVTDTGHGMTEEVRRHATEPFFTTRQDLGTGLGLSMAYGFMRQSRGLLIIESSPGQGASLKMLFPVYGGTHAAETEAEPSVEETPSFGEATVLVVEDRAEVRQFAVRCLDKPSFTILQAENAEKAIDVLEKNDQVDVLFTDILMPGGMNGRELADWAIKKYPNLKVLLTTAAEKESELHMHGNRVFDMLHKPYSKQDLLKHIHAIL